MRYIKMRVLLIIFGLVGSYHNILSRESNPTAPIDALRFYSGDFTDTDGDGMTDNAEVLYGYDPTNSNSFPVVDFMTDNGEPTNFKEVDIGVSGLRVGSIGSLLIIEYDNWFDDFYYDATWSWRSDDEWLYATFVPKNNKTKEWAIIDLSRYDMSGTENFYIEPIPMVSYDIDYLGSANEIFKINLSDFDFNIPTVNNYPIGSSDNKITFQFINFNEEQTTQYIDFLQRVIPILNSVVGHPLESFKTTIEMQPFNANSWANMDQGRLMLIDGNWNPRLFVHELIHMWDGKYGFGWSGPNRSYSDSLSGFAEVVEGVAYKVLHKFVEAYPTHSVSAEVISGGSWNNWCYNASGFDMQKNQKILQGGDVWADSKSISNQYSVIGMTMLNMLSYDEDFYRKMRKKYAEIILEDESRILKKDEIVDLWAKILPKVNGVNTKDFLGKIPAFDGIKLEQNFYPVIKQNYVIGEDASHRASEVYGAYALDGYTWWQYVTSENINSFNIPNWVRYTKSGDYYYSDTMNMSFSLEIKNIFDEQINLINAKTHSDYDEQGDPRDVGSYEISDAMHSSNFGQGLYSYNLTFTELTDYTNNASDKFYFMGIKDFDQTYLQHSLFFGIDSKFAEYVVVEFKNFRFELPIINGCAILRTQDLNFNDFGVMKIHVSSYDKTFTYERALVHAGDNAGFRHQQYLIIDKDFDGIEDLYDDDIDEYKINADYIDYTSKYPNHRTENSIDWKLGKIALDIKTNTTHKLSDYNLRAFRIGDKIEIHYDKKPGHYFDMTYGVSNAGIMISERRFEDTPTGEMTYFTLDENDLNGTEKLDVGNFYVYSNDSNFLGFTDLQIIDLGELTYETDDTENFESHSDDIIITDETDSNSVYESYDSSDQNYYQLEDTNYGYIYELDNSDSYDFYEQDDTQILIENVWNSNVIDIGNNWKYVDWFGYFYESKYNFEWKFHSVLGWLYIPGDSYQNVWMYSEVHGWLWTTSEFFPYVYKRDYGWLYFEENQYYDFQLNNYVAF